VLGYGIIFSLWLVIPGGLMMTAGLFGWALEPADDLDIDDQHGPSNDELAGASA
jgi:cytochrome c oxidase subunit 1